MRHLLVTVVMIAATVGLTSCATSGNEDLSGRCAELMRRAFPGGDIEVTRTRAFVDTAPNYDTIIAEARGVRRDVPASSPDARQIAAHCRFYNGILTGFRWTEGPLQRTASTRR